MAAKASSGEQFRIKAGTVCDLSAFDPGDKSGFADKMAAKEQLRKDSEAIDALQNRLYAEGKQSLLVILQGIDGSGKDGTTRAVFQACSPMGLQVTSFKAPTEIERAHDYLWRVHAACPPKGVIGIFNRSHYEDVLVVKVEGLAAPDAIERRYDEINQFEKLLVNSGTRIVKFMLHLSRQEQAVRLQERVDVPEKRWKFNPSDLQTRAKWDAYMQAYETALTRCSTDVAPWYVIPADHNWMRNASIAAIVRATLEDMAPQFPQPKGWVPKDINII